MVDAPRAAVTAADSGAARYTGVRLNSLLTLPSLGDAAREHRALFAARCARFVTCQVSSRNDHVTYDLRLLSLPVPSNPSRSDIRLYLLARLDGADESAIAALGQDTLSLLHAAFPEHGFAPIAGDELQQALDPFAPASLVAITRRTSIEELTTLRSPRRRYSIGFQSDLSEPVATEPPTDALFHVFPFLPASGDFTALLGFLTRMQGPACISIRLQPATMTEAEEAFLQGQVVACERHKRLRRAYPADEESDLASVLRHQADTLELFQQRMLFGLWDDAALMTIEIASAVPMPRQLIDLTGSLVTAPAGGTRPLGAEPLSLYFAGGYDVYDRSNQPESLMAFRAMRLEPAAPIGVPAAAARLVHLFDAAEAANAFRLPACPDHELPGLALDYWRSLPAPGSLPDAGTALGVNRHRGIDTPIGLAMTDRRRHLYVIGQTGTGKTTLLRSLVLADIEAGHGLCVVDPHGDLFDDLLGRIPPHRRDDVVLLDPTDDFPPSLNLLEAGTELERYLVAQELAGIFERLIQDEYGVEALRTFAGPIFFQHLRMNALLLMSKPGQPGTLLDLYRLFQRKDEWRKWLPIETTDESLRTWVEHVLPNTDYTRAGSEGPSLGHYIGSKLEGILFDPRLRNIFGQPDSTIDLRRIMDDGRILLVNLAKGSLTEPNSRLLGMVLLGKLIAATFSRKTLQEQQRRLFHVYVDEFQALATQGFITLLSEARKFGVSLVLANQFLSQVRNTRIIDAIFGNVGNLIAFRIGHQDAALLEPQFAPELSRHDLLALPNWIAYARTLANGERVAPFNVSTTVNVPPYDVATADQVRDHSERNWSGHRKVVETDMLRAESRAATQ